jgi:hypothetical protein
VERLDHACVAHVHRSAPFLPLAVGGVPRPAVVECLLGVGDDLADRRFDRGRIPRLLEQLLVAPRIEKRQR